MHDDGGGIQATQTPLSPDFLLSAVWFFYFIQGKRCFLLVSKFSQPFQLSPNLKFLHQSSFIFPLESLIRQTAIKLRCLHAKTPKSLTSQSGRFGLHSKASLNSDRLQSVFSRIAIYTDIKQMSSSTAQLYFYATILWKRSNCASSAM